MRSSVVNPRAVPKRSSIEVAGLRLADPERMRTLQRLQTPTPSAGVAEGDSGAARYVEERLVRFRFGVAAERGECHDL